MSPQTTGLIIGGLFAALLYGISNLFTKASTQAGIGIGWYLIVIGVVVTMAGLVFFFIIPDQPFSFRAGAYAGLLGLFWGLGTGCIAIALTQYQVPLGKLVPIFNMNTLISVLLALWIFAEWKQVRVPQLLIGSVLIVVGGTLVAKA